MAMRRYLETGFEGPVRRSVVERARAWLEVKFIALGRPALKAVAEAGWCLGKPESIILRMALSESRCGGSCIAANSPPMRRHAARAATIR
jgi:hypothetical protein